MTCQDLDLLLCDYADGTLDASSKAAVDEHLATCGSCAELAADIAGATAFMSRCASVEPPPELVTRILYDIPGRRTETVRRGRLRQWFADLFAPVLQPRFSMGMAMTILSFSMLGRFAMPVRQLKPSDLNPVQVWSSVEDSAHRTWQRGVKYYESLKLVFEIQSRLREWTEEEEADRKAQERAAGAKGSGTQPGQKKSGTREGATSSPDSAPTQ
ncbi:MAG: hypothetical protein FJW40_21290 [Acidobacteria bacterium]|nr:hypothetical protein [Acidobacteriota bacterium]